MALQFIWICRQETMIISFFRSLCAI